MKNLLFALTLFVAASMLKSTDESSIVYSNYESARVSCSSKAVIPYYVEEHLAGYICGPNSYEKFY